MARRQRRAPAVHVKRLSEWTPIQIIAETTVASNAILLAASSSAGLLALAPYTVVRTRGVLTVWSDQVAVSEAPQGIFAAIVVKNSAVAIGATAMSDPLNEAGDDWYVYEPFQIPAMRQTTNNLFTEYVFAQYVIDSKAMRKIDTGDD